MNILITGASGFVGQSLIKSLVKYDHSITACIHKTELDFDVKIVKVDFMKMLNITDWLPLLKGIDVVINCVGIISENSKHSFNVMHNLSPIALFKACEKTDVKRIIQISALGADDSAIVKYHKSKKQADDFLRKSPCEWFVLRPSLIFGQGGTSYRFFKRLSNLFITPLIGSGDQKIQPVTIEYMIKVIERCIVSKQPNQTIDVVSRKAITYKQWMKQLRCKKSSIRFMPIPKSWINRVAQLLSPFNLTLISRDNLIMLEQNNTADYLPLKTFMEKLN